MHLNRLQMVCWVTVIISIVCLKDDIYCYSATFHGKSYLDVDSVSFNDAMGLTFFSFPVRWNCVFFVLTCISWGARMSQWWEQRPPTSVTRVQIPASTQYVRVSMGLTVRRRERLFFIFNLQKCTVILTVKTFQGIANLTISADLHGLLAPEESLHLKNHWPCCENTPSESPKI